MDAISGTEVRCESATQDASVSKIRPVLGRRERRIVQRALGDRRHVAAHIERCAVGRRRPGPLRACHELREQPTVDAR